MCAVHRVGFIIDSRVPTLQAVLRRHVGALALWRGQPSGSSVGVMRFGWVAAQVNRDAAGSGLRYELYRPWRRYAAVVFLKSMGDSCLALAQHLRSAGTKVIFDANVDYFTPAAGAVHYEGMAPTGRQRNDAVAMAGLCDLLLADSERIAETARPYARRVEWIPDNVDLDQVPAVTPPPALGTRLVLGWSGEAHKLYDLLAIEDVLRALSDRVRLELVTSDLRGTHRWSAAYQDRFRTLLDGVEHRIRRFVSIPALFEAYRGVHAILSPRFLDNTYNLGHTEWKITLGMACGRMALCSPQPSYLTVARRAGGRGIRVCATRAEWEQSLADLLEGRVDPAEEGRAARAVVEQHYATPGVAAAHARAVRQVIEATA